MKRPVITGLLLLPLLGFASGPARAVSDFRDVPYLQARINLALEREPTGAEVEWRNEETGNSGVIRVLRTYFPSPKAPCREYERTTRQPTGSDTLVRGTGCRDASGRWRLKEEVGAAAPGGPGSSAPRSPAPETSKSGATEPDPRAAGAGPPTTVTGKSAATDLQPSPPKPEEPEASEPTKTTKATKASEAPQPAAEIPIELPTRSD